MREVTAKELIENPETFVMSASWCGPCKALKHSFKDVDVPYLNYDEDEHDTLLLLMKNGIVISRFPTLVEYKEKFEVSPQVPSFYLAMARKAKHEKDYIEFTEYHDK